MVFICVIQRARDRWGDWKCDTRHYLSRSLQREEEREVTGVFGIREIWHGIDARHHYGVQNPFR